MARYTGRVTRFFGAICLALVKTLLSFEHNLKKIGRGGTNDKYFVKGLSSGLLEAYGRVKQTSVHGLGSRPPHPNQHPTHPPHLKKNLALALCKI